MRKDVPSGWVELRQAVEVPERLRRPVIKAGAKLASLMEVSPEQAQRIVASGETDQAAAQIDMSDAALDATFAFQDALVLALVREWSFGEVSEAGLMDLPGKTLDAVRSLCMPFMADLMPNFGPDPSPDSPTVPSND